MKLKLKLMKNLIILVIITILTFSSCNIITKEERTIRNPIAFTTMEMQKLPKKVVTTSRAGNLVYTFNDKNEVIYTSRLCIPNSTILQIEPELLGILLILCALIMFFIGVGVAQN